MAALRMLEEVIRIAAGIRLGTALCENTEVNNYGATTVEESRIRLLPRSVEREKHGGMHQRQTHSHQGTQ